MRRYHCKAFSILSAMAAAGVLLPLSAQGMQALPVVPLANQQGPYQLGPENNLGNAPILPPVPGPLVGVDAEGVDEAEAMLRGPVHEAFAEQFNQDPVQGLIVPQEPPEPIEELPPDMRPDGRQVEWISGYWAWDDDDQDFFWVSGIWREVPQGFRWLPGYWTQADSGYQWVSGTWIPEQTEEIQYVETAPPESLELGPVGVAPSQEHIWIPGCWNWNSPRYAWRPGYWSTGYSNWIWVPARHVWTPRGYFSCNGYWDYPLNRRGLLFAPYRFRRVGNWNRPRGFTPQVVIAINQLHWNLWVRPRSSHYYFGDYYGPRYANTGFQPWHQFHRQRRQFDPLYSHFSRSAGVGNVSFYDQVNGRFNLLTSQVDRRPARSFNHHEGHGPSRLNNADDRSRMLGSTIQQHIREADNTRFVKLQEDQRIRLQSDSKSVRQLVDQRREVENRGRPESTRLGHQIKDSTGRIKNADQRENERRDRPSSSETRPSEKRSDVAESVIPSGVGERTDRLRLPPVVRRGKDNKELTKTGSSSNVKESESRTPGSPVTRGERPRGVDSVLNRERTPADSNAAGSQMRNLQNTIRDRAARSGARPDTPPEANNPEKAQDVKPLTNHRLEIDNQPDALRRSNGAVESLPDTGRSRLSTERSPRSEPGNEVDASKAKAIATERSPRSQPGNGVDASKARANGTERSPRLQPGNGVDASKARASGAERSPRSRPGSAVDASRARAIGAERSPRPQPGSGVDASKARAIGAEGSPQAQPGNGSDASKSRASGAERSLRAQPDNGVDAAKTRASGAARSGIERNGTERSTVRPSATNPPTRVERQARPPAAGKAGGDAIQRRIDTSVRPQNETRPSPPSRPAVEKPRRTESAPAARPSREQTNPGAGSGERRKKK